MALAQGDGVRPGQGRAGQDRAGEGNPDPTPPSPPPLPPLPPPLAGLCLSGGVAAAPQHLHSRDEILPSTEILMKIKSREDDAPRLPACSPPSLPPSAACVGHRRGSCGAVGRRAPSTGSGIRQQRRQRQGSWGEGWRWPAREGGRRWGEGERAGERAAQRR